jgi:hypothetical protein
MISVVENYCEKIRTNYFFIGLPSSNPRILIPLTSPLIQASSFGLYSPCSIHGNLFKWLGKTAASTGIMNMAGRFFAASVETFNATETIKPILKNQIITGLQNDWEAALGKGKISFALSLGEPNYYQKVTALIFDKNATPIAFAKVACTAQAICLISNEVFALEKISMLRCQSVVMPYLLGEGKTETASWILQSSLLLGRSSRNGLRNEHIAFLSELAQKSVQVLPLNLSDIWKYLQLILKSPVIPIKAGFESERPFVEELCAKIKALNDVDVNKPWPFTIAHGDFAPWNMRLIDGKIALYDWEYFLPLAPAGWDILYYIFREENLIKRQSLERIWRKFESGTYLEKILLFEKKCGLEIPDRKLLAMLVILAIALDLAPKMIADKLVT